MNAPAANQASVEGMRSQLATRPAEADYQIDFFSAKGFELAQRLAKAFATSNAVPPAFRAVNEKKVKGGGIEYIENPAALGNCLIAIETARAVGMSITGVMQNANVIENRLTWSGKFVIAAINASRRFTPLRFDVKNKGLIKATYKEKQGWNEQKRGFDFKDITVEVENLECIAWALPYGMATPPFTADQMRGHSLLELVRAAGLPVVESAPVSMKLAVEEGWYGKSGSKWQTEMKHLMLQYRSGSFYGNIHAPDVVMGMGRSTEEMEDITTVDVDTAGRVTSVTTETLQRPAAQPADVVQHVAQVNTTGTGEEHPIEGNDAKAGADGGKSADTGKPATEPAAEPMTYAVVADLIEKATTTAQVEAAQALVPRVVDAAQQAELNAKAAAREAELTAKPAAKSRRAAGTTTAVE